MQIVVKEVQDLKKEEFDKCYRLNFGRKGQMRGDLLDHYYCPLNSKKTAKAVMIKDLDKNGKDTLIGWALVFPIYKTKGYAAHFYVRSTHRRKGIGTILLNKVAEFDETPIVFPHDHKSGGLLKKTAVRCHVSERIWLR